MALIGSVLPCIPPIAPAVWASTSEAILAGSFDSPNAVANPIEESPVLSDLLKLGPRQNTQASSLVLIYINVRGASGGELIVQ
ncbi:hypothetical protein QA635_30615 [Bradyrhizobium brasilense]|uniref:hypothetical protein n=1 Tax=Bradyrhizobium brasilense TaxID=1419277 RepID=UPI0024B1932E|nr:hypothetical protein [Bradyrhizobium australafricanum]WFU30901.1 hypothetical protein QA635_30615 [Bradyrhizobium australafricanum]